MKFYEENAEDFIERTINVDMDSIYTMFEKYLPEGGAILDLGCGPGRDLKAFKSRGYIVEGLEPSEKLREFAIEYSESNVHAITAQDMMFDEEFDGIWACASLLHVPSSELQEVFYKMHRAIKRGGVAYLSFKKGTFEGVKDDGRYFTNMTRKNIEPILEKTLFKIEEFWETVDLRRDNKTEWINLIVRK